MSNKKAYQLKDLKDHEMSPPPFLYDRITDSIENEEDDNIRKILSPLSGHSVNPAEKSEGNDLSDKKTTGILGQLKDHSVAQPAAFETLRAKAQSFSEKGRLILLKSRFKKLAAAAALVVFVAVTYIMVQQNSPAERPVADHPDTTLPAPVAANHAPAITKTTTPGIAGSPQINKISPLPSGKTSVDQPNPGKKNSSPVIYIDGSSYAVKNNDYLAMLTSFNENRMPAFLLAPEAKEAKITVDKYSSISVSEGMAAILKKTYSTKRNGRPTRKARKQKEKIEKWKKTDEEYFKNSTRNPLDPVDLGDFILYK